MCLLCQKDIIGAKRRVSLWDGDVVSAKGKVIDEAFALISPSKRDFFQKICEMMKKRVKRGSK